jgi:hypothetical protein
VSAGNLICVYSIKQQVNQGNLIQGEGPAFVKTGMETRRRKGINYLNKLTSLLLSKLKKM